MALIVDKKLTKKITVSNFVIEETKELFEKLYCKIESINGSKELITVVVAYFYNDKPIKRESFEFTPDINNFNYISQGYNYLKTLDEFKDAEDC